MARRHLRHGFVGILLLALLAWLLRELPIAGKAEGTRKDAPAPPPAAESRAPGENRAPGAERALETFTGKVVGVSDGDTLSILRDGRAVKVRLHGVDCPESGQPFGRKAKEFTSDLAFGKEVSATVRGKDRYSRTIAQVSLPDGRSLEKELLRAGFAWWYREYSSDGELARLESEAREGRRGLWAGDAPTAPWAYRKARRSP